MTYLSYEFYITSGIAYNLSLPLDTFQEFVMWAYI